MESAKPVPGTDASKTSRRAGPKLFLALLIFVAVVLAVVMLLSPTKSSPTPDPGASPTSTGLAH